MRATEDLHVTFEQPGETLDDIAAVRSLHAAPVSVDESLVTLQDAARIARDGLAEVFGIKLNRVGGLTKAARMRDIALAHGIDMFVMASGGSVLADCEALHLAATIPDENCRAVWSCQDMLTVDIAGGPRSAQHERAPAPARKPRSRGSPGRGCPGRPGGSLRMKITRVALWHVPLTSHDTYYMADGKTCDTIESVVIAVDTGRRPLTGWGEVCPIPHYLPAYARGVAPAMEELAPVILGADPVGPEALLSRANDWLPGHRYTKSALDIALWDITGKAAGLPLHALLGGRRTADMPLYHSITCIAPEDMARIAGEARAQGIAQFQVKLGADANWEADVARLRLGARGGGRRTAGLWRLELRGDVARRDPGGQGHRRP